MAAIFIFVSGALFSFYQGIHELLNGEAESGGWVYTYVALARRRSCSRAPRCCARCARPARTRATPAGRSGATCASSRDPTTKTVVFEDSAAVTGVVIAAVGVGLYQLTGNAAFDGAASILIGVLLAVVAVALWRDTRGLLIGEAALPEEREAMRSVLSEHHDVDEVVELLTMALGPDTLLVARAPGPRRRPRLRPDRVDLGRARDRAARGGPRHPLRLPGPDEPPRAAARHRARGIERQPDRAARRAGEGQLRLGQGAGPAREGRVERMRAGRITEWRLRVPSRYELATRRVSAVCASSVDLVPVAGTNSTLGVLRRPPSERFPTQPFAEPAAQRRQARAP